MAPASGIVLYHIAVEIPIVMYILIIMRKILQKLLSN